VRCSPKTPYLYRCTLTLNSPHGEQPVTDEIRFRYQTQKWDRPAKFVIEETGRDGGMVTLRARLLDGKGVQCLDARNGVRFAIAGDGELMQNMGTSTGSRQVELYHGRAIIRAPQSRYRRTNCRQPCCW
jgi:beta-galactosidase